MRLPLLAHDGNGWPAWFCGGAAQSAQRLLAVDC